MKEWLAERLPARSIDELQGLLDEFRTFSNEERPHQGIADVTPAERFKAKAETSSAILPGPPSEAVYLPGAITRQVTGCGNLGFKGHTIQVGSEWNHYTLRVAMIEGVVHLFYGEQLVRALTLSLDIEYNPIGRKRDRIAMGARDRAIRRKEGKAKTYEPGYCQVSLRNRLSGLSPERTV